MIPGFGMVFQFPGGLAAGFAALIITGLSWCVVGIVMGSAPRRGVDTGLLQFFAALATGAISAGILLCMGANAWQGDWKAILAYFFSGASNYVMLEFMAIAMQRGPNGVIWSMVQSGTVFPFFMGVLFFNVAPAPLRLIGVALLIIALFAFGSSKSESGKGIRYWLLPTLLSFLFCGLQQCLMSLPSYFTDCREMSPVFRTLLSSFGTISGSGLALIVHSLRTGKNKIPEQLKMKHFWSYLAMYQMIALLVVYLLTYNGIDTLAAAGIGAISYPLMVASCIVGFSLYSIGYLREKNRWPQYLAFFLCLIGIICLCSS